jgi:hypothetical protein
MKKKSKLERYCDYLERNFTHSFTCKLRKPSFCLLCKSQQCNNLSHKHIILHPIIRIPKKRAKKKEWDILFKLIRIFHEKELNNVVL